SVTVRRPAPRLLPPPRPGPQGAFTLGLLLPGLSTLRWLSLLLPGLSVLARLLLPLLSVALRLSALARHLLVGASTRRRVALPGLAELPGPTRLPVAGGILSASLCLLHPAALAGSTLTGAPLPRAALSVRGAAVSADLLLGDVLL